MKILIAHHVESMWEHAMQKIYGENFENVVFNIGEFCKENEIDKIILTRFEDFEPEDIHLIEWNEFPIQVETYGYGWDQDLVIDDEHGEYVDGGVHSEYVQIQGWMYDLKGHEVSLAGCFDGECIEDMEIALEHCEIEFKRVETCII